MRAEFHDIEFKEVQNHDGSHSSYEIEGLVNGELKTTDVTYYDLLKWCVEQELNEIIHPDGSVTVFSFHEEFINNPDFYVQEYFKHFFK